MSLKTRKEDNEVMKDSIKEKDIFLWAILIEPIKGKMRVGVDSHSKRWEGGSYNLFCRRNEINNPEGADLEAGRYKIK